MLFVNATKVYQFKAKNCEIKDYALCLVNVSKDFTINNTKENRIKRSCNFFFFFFVNFNPVDTNSILVDIHKYLMKRLWLWYELMLELIKKIFIGLLTGLVNGSNHTKCILWSNQKYEIQPTLID